MRRLTGRFAPLATALSLVVSSVDAVAQTVQLVDRGRVPREIRARIEDVLSTGRYRVWTRDTTLGAEDSVDGDLFLFHATARVAGVVTGRVIAVEAELFVRPGAQLRGGAVVLNGGYYGTEMAEIGPVDHLPIADYRARQGEGAGGFRIVPPRPRSGLSLPGVSGLLFPTYERVNALTVPWAIDYKPAESSAWPQARGILRYRTARGRLDGELRLRWEGGLLGLDLEGGRRTATLDSWISGDVENTLASLGFAADHRNYYEAKFARASLEARGGLATRWRHAVAVEWEQASSLGNEDPFSLFETEGGFRDNPAVDGGRIVLLRLESGIEAGVGRHTLVLSGFWEVANRGVAGTFTYARAGGAAKWEMPTFSDHRLRLWGRGGGPLAGTVPRQRWVALGGYRTLPTIDALSLRGDTYVFVQSTYFVPLASGGLGGLVGWVQHGLGSAWVGPRPRLEHNLGLGLDVGPFAVWLFADPRASGLDFTAGFGQRQL